MPPATTHATAPTPLAQPTPPPLSVPISPRALHLVPPGVTLPYTFRFTQGERAVFRAKERSATNEPLTVPEWSARHRVITDGPSRGRWTNEMTPYAIKPMECWTIPSVRTIVLCFAPQTGKTNVAFNCLSFAADQDPGAAMYIMPDEKVTRRIARRRIIPLFRNTPRLAGLLSDRDADTTSLSIRLANGMDLMMAWATSAAAMASESARYVIFDETDKYPDFAGKEADPFSLGEVRANAYPFTCKFLFFSTPSEDPSRVWILLKTECDVVYIYEVPCPICGHFQAMNFSQFWWPGNVTDPRTVKLHKSARYSCASCGMKWDDYHKNHAVRHGRWIPGRITDEDEWEPISPPARPVAVGFWLPSWYSPFISLSSVVAAHLKGKQSLGAEIAFVTQHEARPYKKQAATTTEAQLLLHRTTLPSAIVPRGAIGLTAGVDVQKIGFWFVIRAWMDDLTSHKIQHGFVPSWADLEKILFDARYPLQDNPAETMAIWRTAIDTGGSATESDVWTRTEEIYQWLRSQAWRGSVFGVKGSSRIMSTGKRIQVSVIDKMPRSNLPIPGGLDLRILDTSQYKAILHWRLTRSGTENQQFFLDADTDVDYARQFLSEKLHSYRSGKQEWKGTGANHLLDCEVYAAAAADSQWLPSLTMMAAYLKAQETSQAEPPQLKQEPAADPRERLDSFRSRESTRPSWLNR